MLPTLNTHYKPTRKPKKKFFSRICLAHSTKCESSLILIQVMIFYHVLIPYTYILSYFLCLKTKDKEIKYFEHTTAVLKTSWRNVLLKIWLAKKIGNFEPT